MAEGEAVGPFPDGADPDSYDRSRRRILWTMPSGLYVLGSCSGDRRNLMTLSWATQVATDPKLVAVSVEEAALTRRLIGESRVFSLNILGRKDRAAVRKFVKPLADEGLPGELAGFPVFQAATGAPILGLSVAWLDCRVARQLSLGSHTVFVGEVVDCGWGAGSDSDEPDSGEPEILRMEDTRMSYGG